MTNSAYLLGIDGGGTKTAFALADSNGQIIRQLRLDPCNPYDVGIDTALIVLKTGIVQICDGIPLSSVCVFAGLAGCKSPEYADAIASLFCECSFASFEVDSDNENIIAAGLGDSDGITLILGTGICSFAVRNHIRYRISGWGYLFDEGGSAYNIGRDAISRYYSAFDGSGPATTLSSRIEAFAGKSGTELLNKLYADGKKYISSFAPLVFEEAAKGDAVSMEIIRRNVREIARILRAALAYFPEPCSVPVILAGGLTAQPCLLPMIETEWKEPRCDIKILSVSPVEGALQRAAKLKKEYET